MEGEMLEYNVYRKGSYYERIFNIYLLSKYLCVIM